jgi:hypothetical protein
LVAAYAPTPQALQCLLLSRLCKLTFPPSSCCHIPPAFSRSTVAVLAPPVLVRAHWSRACHFSVPREAARGEEEAGGCGRRCKEEQLTRKWSPPPAPRYTLKHRKRKAPPPPLLFAFSLDIYLILRLILLSINTQHARKRYTARMYLASNLATAGANMTVATPRAGPVTAVSAHAAASVPALRGTTTPGVTEEDGVE